MPRWLPLLLRVSLVLGVLAPPLLATYGLLVPWPVAQAELADRKTERAILVGVAYQSRVAGDQRYERRTQTYALFPSSLSTFETVSVVQENGQVTVSPQPGGLLVPIVILLGSAIGIVWLWRRSRA
jgi:hypothetical protein